MKSCLYEEVSRVGLKSYSHYRNSKKAGREQSGGCFCCRGGGVATRQPAELFYMGSNPILGSTPLLLRIVRKDRILFSKRIRMNLNVLGCGGVRCSYGFKLDRDEYTFDAKLVDGHEGFAFVGFRGSEISTQDLSQEYVISVER